MKDVKSQNLEKLKKLIEKTMAKKTNLDDLIQFSLKLYEKGYSTMDIIELLEKNKLLVNKISNEKKYELLITYNKVRKEFRNEKLLILFILNFLFLSSELSLENISFM
jgi:hypothetical protein